MKHIILLIIIVLSASCTFRKQNNNKVISQYADTLFDKSTNITFYLDTSRTVVYAYAENNKFLWKTNPRKDNQVMEYRVINPKIYYFNLDSMWLKNDEIEIVRVKYNNSQRVNLDKKTGKMLGLEQL